MKQLNSARSALSFLTIFPVGGLLDENTARYFFIPGLVVGLSLGAAWMALRAVFPPISSAVIVVILDVILTGGLHYDGVADSGDGLIAPMDKELRLKAMAEPALGAFGVLSLLLVVAMRVAALADQHPSVALLVGLMGLSRSFMAVAVGTFPSARPNGLSAPFQKGDGGTTGWPTIAVGIAISFTCLVVAVGVLSALLSAFAMGVVATSSAGLAYKKLNGVSGDVVGGAGLVGESFALMMLVTLR